MIVGQTVKGEQILIDPVAKEVMYGSSIFKFQEVALTNQSLLHISDEVRKVDTNPVLTVLLEGEDQVKIILELCEIREELCS